MHRKILNIHNVYSHVLREIIVWAEIKKIKYEGANPWELCRISIGEGEMKV